MISTLWSRALRRDPCAWCNGRGGTVDHLVPQALGGDDRWENLAGACRRCNASRGIDTLVVHLTKRAGGTIVKASLGWERIALDDPATWAILHREVRRQGVRVAAITWHSNLRRAVKEIAKREAAPGPIPKRTVLDIIDYFERGTNEWDDTPTSIREENHEQV